MWPIKCARQLKYSFGFLFNDSKFARKISCALSNAHCTFSIPKHQRTTLKKKPKRRRRRNRFAINMILSIKAGHKECFWKYFRKQKTLKNFIIVNIERGKIQANNKNMKQQNSFHDFLFHCMSAFFLHFGTKKDLIRWRYLVCAAEPLITHNYWNERMMGKKIKGKMIFIWKKKKTTV